MSVVSAHIPQKELEDFESLLEELKRDTRKSQKRIITETGIGFCQVAGNNSPKSKKRRTLEKNPNYNRQAAKINELAGEDYYGPKLTKKNRYMVYRGDEKWWEYTNERSAKRVPGTKIKYQGALKNSWKGLIGDISKRSPKFIGASQNKRGWRSSYRGDTDDSREGRTVTLRNRIHYLYEVTPMIDRTAMDGANKILANKLDRVRQNWKEKWR